MRSRQISATVCSTRAEETLTRRDRVFDHVEDRILKTPVTLPVGHGISRLEMFCKVVHPDGPRVHDDATETAPRANFGSCYFPWLHRPGHELGFMNQLQMLAEMVFPVESSLFQGPLLASRMVMALNVGIIWVGFSAENTAHAVILRIQSAGTIRSTHPPLEGKMK
jgi:hypothetical protein